MLNNAMSNHAESYTHHSDFLYVSDCTDIFGELQNVNHQRRELSYFIIQNSVLSDGFSTFN